MPRYIDADKLIEQAVEVKLEDFAREIEVVSKKQIANAPTADVQPVIHGEWLGTENDGYSYGFPVYTAWKCSNCGAEFECEDIDFHYCPRCGAYMDLKEHKDEST